MAKSVRCGVPLRQQIRIPGNGNSWFNEFIAAPDSAKDRRPAQRVLVQPGGLIWKDPTVSMFLHFEYPHGQYWFSSPRWQAKSTWLALQGPGRIAVQSVFERPEQVGSVRRSSPATQQAW